MANNNLLAAMLCDKCRRFSVHSWQNTQKMATIPPILKQDKFFSQQHLFRCRICGGQRQLPVLQGSIKITNSIPQLPEMTETDSLIHYNSAMGLLNKDPKGATTMIRASLEAFAKQCFNPDETNLGEIVFSLAKKGIIPFSMRKAMDFIRHSGNSATHSDKVMLGDVHYRNADEVKLLFGLLYKIVLSVFPTGNGTVKCATRDEQVSWVSLNQYTVRETENTAVLH